MSPIVHTDDYAEEVSSQLPARQLLTGQVRVSVAKELAFPNHRARIISARKVRKNEQRDYHRRQEAP